MLKKDKMSGTAGKVSGKAFTERKKERKGGKEEKKQKNCHTTTMQQIGSVQ